MAAAHTHSSRRRRAHRLLVALLLLAIDGATALMAPQEWLRRVRVDVYEGRVAVQFDVKYEASTAPRVEAGAIEVREAPGKGRGAFAARAIKRGTFLGSYVGEELDPETFRNRFADREPRYVVRVDSGLYLDGEQAAQDAEAFTPALLNHGDRPNVVRYCSRRRQPARVDFFADEDLEPGVELLVDYGPQYWYGRESEKSLEDVLDTQFFDPNAEKDQGAVVEYLKARFREDPESFKAAYVALTLSALVFLAQFLVKWYKYNIWQGHSPDLTDLLDF